LDQAMKNKLEKFLHRKEILKELRRLAAAGQKSLVVEFEHLLEFDMELSKALLEGPNDFLDASDAVLTEITKLPGMRLRVNGLDKSTVIRDIRSEQHVGKFIQVEGVMTRMSKIKSEVREAVFKCLRCGELNRVMQIDEVFREPLICENPNCNMRGPFKLEVESSEFRDWQNIKIQERSRELQGRMLEQLDGIIRDDFVDKAVPGNYVVASGILRVSKEVQRQRNMTFRKILFINHIEVLQKGIKETELSPDDEARVKELTKNPWVRNLIIQSIAPSVYGYEPVKEGIALQLFGCSPVELPDGARIRGDIHILLIGDLSVPKSQMLKWAAQVAPLGLYISGKKAPEITASAVHDEIDGGQALEAGALVMGDGGLCCIDEFDEINEDNQTTLREALGRQTININGGFGVTLNTRAAVLATATPMHGWFDRNKLLGGQMKNLSQETLSRFDSIFIISDAPLAERDRAVAHSILELYHEPTRIVKPPFDSDTLRKIIIYARKYIDPKLEDEEARKKIEDFYVKCRSVAESGKAPVPITPRQLEALIRLAKANARMRFSDHVTVEDANRAIKIISFCLREAGVDIETGKIRSHRKKCRGQ
jgi:replicative DNA helicase Mcm